MQISQTLPLLFALSPTQPLLADVSLCQNFLTQSHSVIGQFVKLTSFETGNIASGTHLSAFRKFTGEGKVNFVNKLKHCVLFIKYIHY